MTLLGLVDEPEYRRLSTRGGAGAVAALSLATPSSGQSRSATSRACLKAVAASPWHRFRPRLEAVRTMSCPLAVWMDTSFRPGTLPAAAFFRV
jgi:hypothetical protein